jgi:RimJ/RimL family protein N-acetyltransferase
MISIEPLSFDHASAMAEAAQESIGEVNPWLPWCTSEFSLPQVTEWIANQIQEFAAGSAYQFAIIGGDGEYLGGGGINNVNKKNNFADVGY